MKAETAFVRSDRIVELHAPGAVGAEMTFIVYPGNAEDDDPVGFGEPFEDLSLFVFGVIEEVGHQRLGHLADSLMKLMLVRVSFFQPVHERFDFGFHTGFRCAVGSG